VLQLKNVEKKFSSFSLGGISFEVGAGECLAVAGPSGAGKSLILEIISGFVRPDGGTVVVNRRDVTRSGIQGRGVGYLPQHHALFPHMSVRENIAYGIAGLKKEAREEAIAHVAAELGIEFLLDRAPLTLSGGEQQRAGLARVLVTKPAVLLLDESLRSLDADAADDMLCVLKNINRRGLAMVHVTHDRHEAKAIASRAIRIDAGRIAAEGPPSVVIPGRRQFIRRPGTLIVGGSRSDAGKTEFVCRVIRKFSATNTVVALKVTMHYEERDRDPAYENMPVQFSIFEETDPARPKDTGRMLAAGAQKVLWLKVKERFLREGLLAALARVPEEVQLVIESNAAATVIDPDLFLMVMGEGEVKPSARRLLKYASARIASKTADGGGFLPDEGALAICDRRWALK